MEIRKRLRALYNFVEGFIRDPNTLDGSSSRGIAWGCAIVAWIVVLHAAFSIGGLTLAVASVTTALIGGGAVAIMTKTSTTPEQK